jgi:hypothetical protein
VDGSVDGDGADAASGAACGFIMPNPVNAPGDLPNRASYTKNGAAHTVTDNVTGLTWEAQVDQTIYTQDGAVLHCQNKAGGNWRLPTRIELVSLIDVTVPKPGPTISDAFADEPVWTIALDSQGFYRRFWTSSRAVMLETAQGWEVDFSDGSLHQKPGADQYKVRCVSGPLPNCSPTRYVRQGAQQDEVHDAVTGLTWQRNFAGKMFWDDALTYCPAGWRLPTPTELETLVDDTQEFPSIDKNVFPCTPFEQFWTSSPQAGTADGGVPTFAWYATFAHGHTDVYPTDRNNRNNKWWVRCVRWDGL